MKVIKYMQQGGNVNAIPAENIPVNTQQNEQDPVLQIVDIFTQALQNGDCNMLAQGAQMFLQLVAMATNANRPQEPVDQVPEGQPVFKKGGKLLRRKKCTK